MDLSSFPLLRIDQLAGHDDSTLIEAEGQLEVMARGEQGDQQALASFITKLLHAIRHERARRRRAAEDNRLQRRLSPRKGSATTTFFVTSNSPSVGKSSFKARMRQHALSRSHEAEQKERLILDKKRARHAKLKAWREERESAKNKREALLQMEREVRRTKRAEKEKRALLLLTEMQKAADDAREAILVTGCSDLVEAAEMAAKAAAKVIEDGSASVLSASDDDDGSSVESLLDGGSRKVTARVEDVLETKTKQYPIDDLTSTEEGVYSNLADVSCCRSGSVNEDDPTSSDAAEGEQAVAIGTSLAGYVPDGDQLQSGELHDESSISTDDCEDDDSDHTTAFVGRVETDAQAQPEELTNIAGTVAHPSLCLKGPDCSEGIHVGEEPTQSPSPTPRNSTQQHHHHQPRTQNRASPCQLDIFTSVASGGAKTINTDLPSHECVLFTKNYEKSRVAYASSQEPIDDSGDEGDELDAFDRGLFYKVKSRRSDVSLIIARAFAHQSLAAIWRELPDQIEESSWNLLWVWGMPKRADFDNLLSFQKINRFRSTRGLTKKDLLAKNIRNKVASTKDESFMIMPLTYALPGEFSSFVAAFSSIGKSDRNLWIMKPVGLSRGRGISVISDIAQVSYSCPVVLQRYIADPFLPLANIKFDLRMYVLVTSFSPLEAFIYREGLARFATRAFSLQTLGDLRVHLTNTSIQREFGDILDTAHPAILAGKDGSGNKVSFTWLMGRLRSEGVNTEELWGRIVDCCRKALLAAGDVPHQPNAFEIFGFDLIFDKHRRCWLIEINSSPSLGCESELDFKVKGSLIKDTVLLVDPPRYDRRAVYDACKERLSNPKTMKGMQTNRRGRRLVDRLPRKYGERPRRMGNYTRIYPT